MDKPQVPEIFERLVRTSQDATVRLRVRSSLNPLLWLSGIGSPICFGFALAFQGWVRDTLVIVGILPVVLACGAFLYFMMRRPDDLKSEDFQLRKLALELVETKGGRIRVEPVSVPDISNVESKQPGSGDALEKAEP